MRISIFGLGYVGSVSCAILCQDNDVIGVDLNGAKVDLINAGRSPIVEKHTDELIREGVGTGRLIATTDCRYAVSETDISVVCVGTPSTDSGAHKLTYVHRVIDEIVDVLKQNGERHILAIRSTVPPGTTEGIIAERLQGLDVGVCFNPEFLREGSAVADYYDPPYIIVACTDEGTVAVMREFYRGIDAEFILTSFKEAEAIKMVSNVFHALKIVFANEVGRFAEAYGLDGKRLMEVLCMDRKLNVSEKYLMPGFAYGGSCLPKDLRGLLHLAREQDLNLPIISHIEVSNEQQIIRAIKRIESYGTRRLGFVGLTFKKGTDDLRESPYVRLVEYFLGKGYSIKIFDEDLSVARVTGSNREYMEKEVPHLSALLVTEASELGDAEAIVIGKHIESVGKEVLEGKDTVDLV